MKRWTRPVLALLLLGLAAGYVGSVRRRRRSLTKQRRWSPTGVIRSVGVDLTLPISGFSEPQDARKPIPLQPVTAASSRQRLGSPLPQSKPARNRPTRATSSPIPSATPTSQRHVAFMTTATAARHLGWHVTWRFSAVSGPPARTHTPPVAPCG